MQQEAERLQRVLDGLPTTQEQDEKLLQAGPNTLVSAHTHAKQRSRLAAYQPCGAAMR